MLVLDLQCLGTNKQLKGDEKADSRRLIVHLI